MTLALNAASRWAGLVAKAILSDSDPHGVEQWARLCGVSAGSIRQTCRVVNAGARRSLTLARLLRSVRLAAQYGHRPCDLLEVEDARTICKLGRLAGIDLYGEGPYALDDVIRRQLIVQPEALREALLKSLMDFKFPAEADDILFKGRQLR